MDIIFYSIVYNESMNTLYNSQDCQYGKYSVFAVVLALVFMISSAAFAQVASTTGQEHNNDVSRIVQELKKVAGRDSNIEQEVSSVAQEQEDSAKTVQTAMNKVDAVGKFRQLFLGTDYKNLGVLRSEFVNTQNAIDRITKAMERATDGNIKADLQKQI